MKLLYPVLTVLLLSLSTACNKLIDIPDSKNQIEGPVVFADSAAAVSALLGAYVTFSNVHTRSKLLALYADEYNFTASTASTLEFSKSQLLTNNTEIRSLWTDLYAAIYQSNAVIEGADQSAALSAAAKRMLKGEAKFLRSFAHFYLLNLYDNVPLLLNTNINVNRSAKQTTPQQVYDQIIQDLQEAATALDTDYKGAGKVRANRACANALLSRLYLYQRRWADAERTATAIIGTGTYGPLPKVEDAFLAGSKEAIFQLWTTGGFLTDAAQVIPASATVIPSYTIADGLYLAMESKDERRSKWIATNNVITNGISTTYNYATKYKNRATTTAKPEFVMALRLAEQYLIRAEARAQQHELDDAIADINVIRSRSGATPLPGNLSQLACLEAVAKERRIELFGEWGHRFLDLKRRGQLDLILGTLKSTWNTEAAKAFPIPFIETTYNANLIQNHGY